MVGASPGGGRKGVRGGVEAAGGAQTSLPHTELRVGDELLQTALLSGLPVCKEDDGASDHREGIDFGQESENRLFN